MDERRHLGSRDKTVITVGRRTSCAAAASAVLSLCPQLQLTLISRFIDITGTVSVTTGRLYPATSNLVQNRSNGRVIDGLDHGCALQLLVVFLTSGFAGYCID